MILNLLKKVFSKKSSADLGVYTLTKSRGFEEYQLETYPTERIFNHLDDLPSYDKLLTAADEVHALSEGMHNKLAAVRVSQDNALILYDKSISNRQDLASLVMRLKKDYSVIDLGIARASVMLSLYAKEASHNSRRDRNNKEAALSVSLFKDIISKAIEENATDVHIVIRDEMANGTAAILFRIDGLVRLIDKIPARNAVEAVGVAYTKLAEASSRSDPAFNRRTMQSCSIPLVINDLDFKLRFQTVPVNGGLDTVIRLLQTASNDEKKFNSAQTKSLPELGYSPSQCQQLAFAARKTVGTIIVSGVTGSGKSTTLKTLMTISPTRNFRKSYSIEDPVEYKIFGVSQISVQRRALGNDSSGFTAAMRVVLRSDPDMVMVGEVRDEETCSLLKTMVQSGHQVMSTVHSASSIDIVQRMTSSELGLPRETLGSRNFLSALVYQRLIPVLCPHCKIALLEAGPNLVNPSTIEILKNKFGLNPASMFTTNPKGCSQCRQMGSKGVTVVAEIILPDNAILRFFREGLDVEAEEYWRQTRRTPFYDEDSTGKTAFEHGLYKAQCGIVDPLVIEDAFEPFEIYQIYDLVEKPNKARLLPERIS